MRRHGAAERSNQSAARRDAQREELQDKTGVDNQRANPTESRQEMWEVKTAQRLTEVCWSVFRVSDGTEQTANEHRLSLSRSQLGINYRKTRNNEEAPAGTPSLATRSLHQCTSHRSCCCCLSLSTLLTRTNVCFTDFIAVRECVLLKGCVIVWLLNLVTIKILDLLFCLLCLFPAETPCTCSCG